LHVPAEPCAEISSTAGDSEAAFRAAGVECAIGAADRAAFAEGNLIGLLLGRWLRFLFGWRGLFFRLDLGILALDLDGVGLFFFFNLRFGFGQALGFVGQNILRRCRRCGQRNRTD